MSSCEIDYIIKTMQLYFDKWDWKKLSLNDKLPLAIVDYFIDQDWDWYVISCHKDIHWEFVEKHIDKNWHWGVLSSQKAMTLDTIEAHPEAQWEWDGISFNPNLNWQFISKYIFKPWNWNVISSTANIKLKTVQKFSTMPWDYSLLLTNPYFLQDAFDIYANKLNTLENFLCWQRFVKSIDLNEFWSSMSMHNCVTMNEVQYYSEVPWNFEAMSHNPNITQYDVERNLDRNWDWFALAYNSNVNSITFAMEHPYFHWWPISRNPDVTWEEIVDNVNEELCWHSLSRNKNITIEIVKNNLNLPWDFDALSGNPNITIEIIMKPENEFLKSRWNWTILSANPNTTYDIVKKYDDQPWDWCALSTNSSMAKLIVLHQLDEYGIKKINWGHFSLYLDFSIDYMDYEKMTIDCTKSSFFTRKRMMFEIGLLGKNSSASMHDLIPMHLEIEKE